MSMRPKDIALEDAQPGMELAGDLVDRHGTVLLQKGSVLSPTLLAALERRGIARLRVLGEVEEAAGVDLAAMRERIEARLAHLFRHSAGAAGQRLRERLRDYRLEQL